MNFSSLLEYLDKINLLMWVMIAINGSIFIGATLGFCIIAKALANWFNAKAYKETAIAHEIEREGLRSHHTPQPQTPPTDPNTAEALRILKAKEIARSSDPLRRYQPKF